MDARTQLRPRFDGAADPRAGRRLLAILAVAAVPVPLAALFGRGLEIGPAAYLSIHTIVELFIAFVGFATFAVQWYAAGARGVREARGRLLGAAALGMAVLEVFHALVFPGMPGLLGPSSVERGIHYWIAARFWMTSALVVAALVPAETDRPLLRRGPLAAASIAGVLAFVLLEMRLPPEHGLLHVPGDGLTGLKIGLEAALAALEVAGVLLYLRQYRRTGDATLLRTAAALGWLVLASICLSLYAHAYDVFNLLGHAYAGASAWVIFDALFVAALLRPYARLDETTRDLVASNARLETLRAHVAGELADTIRRLEETVSELRQLQAEREDILRAVSHDLRNPMQIVLLQAERLQRVLPAQAARDRRSAEAIAVATKQMGSMIRELVEAVRLDSGNLALALEPIDLARWVPERLGLAAGVLDVGRVSYDFDQLLPPVRADPSSLDRVLTNLVGNALKYSPPGTPVRVAAARQDAEVVVSVQDRGAGIHPDDVPKLFQRFQRGRLTQRSEGLGLGLFIVRMLVEAHGGRVRVESTPAEGSTFSFTLPMTPR